MMVVVSNLGKITYIVKNEKYNFEKAIALFNKAVEWAKAEQARIMKEKGERLTKEIMEKMTPMIT